MTHSNRGSIEERQELAKHDYITAYGRDGIFTITGRRTAKFVRPASAESDYPCEQEVRLYFSDNGSRWVLDRHFTIPDDHRFDHMRTVVGFSSATSERYKHGRMINNHREILNLAGSLLKVPNPAHKSLLLAYFHSVMTMIVFKTQGGVPPFLIPGVCKLVNSLYTSVKGFILTMTKEQKKGIAKLKDLIGQADSEDQVLEHTKATSAAGGRMVTPEETRAEGSLAETVGKSLKISPFGVKNSSLGLVRGASGRVDIAKSAIQNYKNRTSPFAKSEQVSDTLIKTNVKGSQKKMFTRLGLSGVPANRVTRGPMASTAGELSKESEYHIYSLPTSRSFTYAEAYAYLIKRIYPDLDDYVVAILCTMIAETDIGAQALPDGDIVLLNVILRMITMTLYLSMSDSIVESAGGFGGFFKPS